MEAIQKQKGFIKSKLASFARVTKRTSQPQCSSKVTPSPSPATKNGLKNQSSLQRVSYASSKPAATTTFFQPSAYVNDTSGKGYVNATHWDSYGGDESVDMKAASYISNVRERFKMERVDSSVAKHQEML